MILGMKEGEEVGPVAGNTTAFIIKNVKIEQPTDTDNYTAILQDLTDKYAKRVMAGEVYNALKNNVKIKDNRTEIF